MADYQKLYALLCGACSDAIEALDRGEILPARHLLQQALFTCEERYVSEDGTAWDEA